MKNKSIVTFAAALILTSIAAHSQALDFVEAHFNGVGGVIGLEGALDVAVSPDGRHVYVVSAFDSAVAIFGRDPGTGALTFIEALFDSAAGVDGLAGVNSLALSADGLHLYTTAAVEDKVGVFSRDPVTGELDFLEVQADPPSGGLGGPSAVALDPLDESVYVASVVDDAVAAFSRDPAGTLAFVEAEFDGVGGVDGLDFARGISVSPDGEHVYVAGTVDDAVALFARDPISSELTFIEVWFDGVGGVEGLDRASEVATSPDGRHLYAAANPILTGDDWLVTFERDGATGSLGFVGFLPNPGPDGLPGCPTGPSDPKSTLAFDPSGDRLYATNASAGALAAFRRDPATGVLSLLETRCEGLDGVEGMISPAGMASSPDGRNIYVSAFYGNSLAVFRTDLLFADGFESGDTSAWSLTEE